MLLEYGWDFIKEKSNFPDSHTILIGKRIIRKILNEKYFYQENRLTYSYQTIEKPNSWNKLTNQNLFAFLFGLFITE